VQELRDLGLADVTLTPHGYVLATVPATSPQPTPVLGWCAHVDTAPNLPGAAKPIVHRAYDGRPIVLPDDPAQILTVETIPHLRGAIGHDVITASGTTLLGADDKAGRRHRDGGRPPPAAAPGNPARPDPRLLQSR
jgi:tripeptide aminopeptidase